MNLLIVKKKKTTVFFNQKQQNSTSRTQPTTTVSRLKSNNNNNKEEGRGQKRKLDDVPFMQAKQMVKNKKPADLFEKYKYTKKYTPTKNGHQGTKGKPHERGQDREARHQLLRRRVGRQADQGRQGARGFNRAKTHFLEGPLHHQILRYQEKRKNVHPRHHPRTEGPRYHGQSPQS